MWLERVLVVVTVQVVADLMLQILIYNTGSCSYSGGSSTRSWGSREKGILVVVRVQIVAGLVVVILVVVVLVLEAVQINTELVVWLVLVRKSSSSGNSTSCCRSHVADTHL